ncbi:MAG TPA: hypothetical protein VKP11_03955, partial [Frankiaceae bacterium]|nr:hypothetical protein [Frankiaceae bacterium]
MTAGPGQAGPGQAGPGYARARLAVGIAGMVASAALVRRDRVGRWEAAVFRRVNGLPDPLFGPVWVVMQSGALGAAPATAALALRAGRRGLARRLLFGGSTTWALSKLV